MTKTTKEERLLEAWQIEDASRLRALYNQRRDEARDRNERFTQDMFAERVGLTSGSMVWQYLSGHRPLNLQAAAAFARGLGVDVEDFSPTIAEKLAQIVSSHQQSASKAAERKLQWVDDDEAKLLSLFRSATDQGRATMMIAGETAPKALGDELAAYKKAKDGARG